MTSPAPGAPSPPPPAPRAPGLAELLEQSLTALVDPGVFRRAAARPAPSTGACVALALAGAGASLAVNLAHGAVADPGLLSRTPPAVLALVGAVALAAYACALPLLALILHALGRGLGGAGAFSRGLQAAAMLSVLGPAQMLCNWFPLAWIVPSLLAAWVAAGALEGFYGARRGRARAASAALAALAIGVQSAARWQAGRGSGEPSSYATTSAAAAGPEGLALQVRPLAAPAAAGAPPQSGLDLLRGPAGASAAAPDGTDGPPAPAAPADSSALPPATGPAPAGSAAELQTRAAGMLDALSPMLAALGDDKRMTPAKRAEVKELQGLIKDLKSQLASGRRPDRAAFASEMERAQRLMLRLMDETRPAPAEGK